MIKTKRTWRFYARCAMLPFMFVYWTLEWVIYRIRFAAKKRARLRMLRKMMDSAYVKALRELGPD